MLWGPGSANADVIAGSQPKSTYKIRFQKYVEIYPFKPDPRTGMAGRYHEPALGVHYEIYWMLEGEVLPTRKLNSFLLQRNKISKTIEETGRESYLTYQLGDYGGYATLNRDALFPVVKAA